MGKKKSNNPSKSYDIIINTDGACAGNPGIMGIGGILKNNKDNSTITTFSEPAGEGSNNEAEYLAVIRGLEKVIELNLSPASLLIQSDSQLIVNQILGTYSINCPHLSRLCKKVKDLVHKLNSKVDFRWISREENKIADALASKAANMPQAVVRNDKVIHWERDNTYIPDKSLIATLPEVNKQCNLMIEDLNTLAESAKFKDFTQLKTHGLDKYSRAKTDFLIECVEARFGENSSEWLREAVGDFEGDYGKTALKWCARGLNPDLALKKVSVDVEVANNILSKKKKSQI